MSAPIVKQLSLLTYNTHLFEDSVVEFVGKVLRKKTVFKDVDRRTELLNRIKGLQPQPDIVCLQEVWAVKWQKLIKEELGKIYRYVYIVPDKGVTATSGLIVASQYSIDNPRFKMYTGLHDLPDKGAQKGVLAFSITLPTPTESTTLNIGTTHCPTDIEDAQRAVKTLAKLTFGSGENDGIVAGDFNLHIEKTTEYERLNQTMAKHHAYDIVYPFLPKIEDSYTDWRWGNKLSIALAGGKKPGKDKKDRIDYVYFAPGSKSHLKPMDAKVFHDWMVDHGDVHVDVSDHYPVLVTFSVN